MSYQDNLASIRATTDVDSLATAVFEIVDNLNTVQDAEMTRQVHNFMLHHNSTIELRIESAMKFLGGKREIQPTSKYDFTKGVVFGYYSSRSRQGGDIAHLLLGVPGLCAILIVAVRNNVTNKTYIHKAVRTFIAGHARAQVNGSGLSDVKVGTRHKIIMEMYEELDTLSKDGSIDTRPVDPLDNPEYTKAVYQGYWHEGKTLKEINEAYLANTSTPTEPDNTGG